jgi:predicted ester cyclase
VNHASPDPSLPGGPAGLKPVFASVLQTFPDIQFSIDGVVAEGDKVVTRWSMRATHRGEVMGVAGTGKPVTLQGISIDRVVDGRIVEHWRVQDDLSLARQVGAIPGASG